MTKKKTVEELMADFAKSGVTIGTSSSQNPDSVFGLMRAAAEKAGISYDTDAPKDDSEDRS